MRLVFENKISAQLHVNTSHLGCLTKQSINVGPRHALCYSYTMGCPPVRGDNPRALASGLSYVQVDKHVITILYHLHEGRHCTLNDIPC